MRPLLVRDEELPDDAIVVVHGGEMQSEYVRKSATFAHDEHGLYLLSLFGAIDGDVARLCATEPDLNRYSKMRLSTFGRLRSSGFGLIPTQASPHFDVVLPDLHESTLARLESCFDPPVANPGR